MTRQINRATRGNFNYSTAPTGDRAVKKTTVACPDCAAPVGARCTTKSGTFSNVAHRSRQRLAVRHARAQEPSYSVADVEFARLVKPLDRLHAREAASLTRAALGRLLGTDGRQVSRWESGGVPGGPEGAAYGAWLRERVSR